MSNLAKHKDYGQRVIERSVQLARNPDAGSRTSGASGLSGTQAHAAVGTQVEAGGFNSFGAPGTRPLELGGVIVTEHSFMLDVDALDDPQAALL